MVFPVGYGRVRFDKAGWARCVKNRKGRVRWGMAVMDRRDGVENGLVGNGLMWQLGWGTNWMGSVWSGVV